VKKERRDNELRDIDILPTWPDPGDRRRFGISALPAVRMNFLSIERKFNL
jgi:hypothetical protein